MNGGLWTLGLYGGCLGIFGESVKILKWYMMFGVYFSVMIWLFNDWTALICLELFYSSYEICSLSLHDKLFIRCKYSHHPHVMDEKWFTNSSCTLPRILQPLRGQASIWTQKCGSRVCTLNQHIHCAVFWWVIYFVTFQIFREVCDQKMINIYLSRGDN